MEHPPRLAGIELVGRGVLIDAWILDESPGTYRWGQIELPPPGADEVLLRVEASALNHLDVWVDPRAAQATAAARAGMRRRRHRRGDRLRRSTASPSATRSSSTPAYRRSPTSSPSATTARSAAASPSSASTCGVGTPRTPIAPARNVVPRPAGRIVGGVRGLPAGDAHRLPHARGAPASPPGRPCSSSASGPACPARRWRSPAISAPRSWPRAAARPSATLRWRWGREAAIDSAAERWDVPRRHRRRERRPGHVGAVGAGAASRAAGSSCAAARRGPRRRSTSR